MSVLIVGSTALDSIKTPQAENPRLLGGSASHAAVAASFFAPVKLIGVVGEDFPARYVQLYKKHRIDLTGLQMEKGNTFHWSGEYEVNMNNRRTLLTELGVFEKFTPHLPEPHKQSAFVLLANIAPALQHHVLDQMARPKFVVADTMDLWLNIALGDLLRLLPRIDGFVLNDSEAHQLTKQDNVHESDSPAGAEIRDHQEGFARIDSLQPEGFLHLSGLSAAKSHRPHRGWRQLRRWIDGVSLDGARSGRREHPARHDPRQRGGELLLRGVRAKPDDAREAR
jgi:sugar/nucleoside kinase (ribokinase family)